MVRVDMINSPFDSWFSGSRVYDTARERWRMHRDQRNKLIGNRRAAKARRWASVLSVMLGIVTRVLTRFFPP